MAIEVIAGMRFDSYDLLQNRICVVSNGCIVEVCSNTMKPFIHKLEKSCKKITSITSPSNPMSLVLKNHLIEAILLSRCTIFREISKINP